MDGQRDFDVVLYGASGFVGELTAHYLAAHAQEARIALAGRSRDKLERVRDALAGPAAGWGLVVADASDQRTLARMARSARVVVSTVGPYRAHGMPLVHACAAAGTHYADLTGEVLFMRESIDRCHALAQRTGARIVHACGFDSIPSDLGVQQLYETVSADRAGKLGRTVLVVTSLRGGVSGGTLASMKVLMDELAEHPERRRVVGDPYALSPSRDREPKLGAERDLAGMRRDPELGIWVGPFVMAPANTRVVRRSNALLSWAYGRRFRYEEVMGFGSGPSAPVKAAAVSGGLAAFTAAMGFSPARNALDRVLPKAGQGPSPELQRTGFFKIDIHTRTTSGQRYVSRVAADGDPGYAATSVMLGEAAFCLAFDSARLPDAAGVVTPATAMGSVLVDRLRAAGQTYDVRREEG